MTCTCEPLTYRKPMDPEPVPDGVQLAGWTGSAKPVKVLSVRPLASAGEKQKAPKIGAAHKASLSAACRLRFKVAEDLKIV